MSGDFDCCVPPTTPTAVSEEVPEWLTTLLGEHDVKGIGYDPFTQICKCGVETIASGPRKRGYEPAHRAHVASVIWSEIERRMEDHGRSPNDPVYGLREDA